jgi:hypothetical protein
MTDRRVPQGIPAPTLDTCNLLVESISRSFDPNRVLLRRLYFINDDKTKYVSVGFYPARNYQPLVEFGSSGNKPITLTKQHVTTMAQHLPRLCEAMCGDEQYQCIDGAFRLTTIGSYKTARLYPDKHYINHKLHDLHVLSNMFHVIQNQLTIYSFVMTDVLVYSVTALTSIAYVEPTPEMSKRILYEIFYEELKNVL